MLFKKKRTECDSWHRICLFCYPFHKSCFWKTYKKLNDMSRD